MNTEALFPLGLGGLGAAGLQALLGGGTGHHRLLGGGPERIPAYASTGELHEPGRRVEQVLRLKSMGFKAVKLRAKAMRVQDDVALVEAVREAVGDGMEIMVDAN